MTWPLATLTGLFSLTRSVTRFHLHAVGGMAACMRRRRGRRAGEEDTVTHCPLAKENEPRLMLTPKSSLHVRFALAQMLFGRRM